MQHISCPLLFVPFSKWLAKKLQRKPSVELTAGDVTIFSSNKFPLVLVVASATSVVVTDETELQYCMLHAYTTALMKCQADYTGYEVALCTSQPTPNQKKKSGYKRNKARKNTCYSQPRTGERRRDTRAKQSPESYTL